MIYFAESFGSSYGGAYAIDSDPKKALRAARSYIGENARTERGSYVLEFPDDANLRSGSSLYGGFSADVPPVRVVARNKLREHSDDVIMGRTPAS